MMDLAEAQDIVQTHIQGDWKKDYYQNLYRGYERDYLPQLAEMLRDVPAGRALDVGPGWGTMMVLLSSWGWNVTVMDYEPQGTYITPALLGSARARYIQDDILDGALPEKFDLVLCTQVLLHLKYRPDRALRNLAAMLEPDGLAILSALKPESYPDLKSAYGPDWQAMPQYGEGPARPDVVMCLLPREAFAELLMTAFVHVELVFPSDSTVMFAKCRNPRNDV